MPRNRGYRPTPRTKLYGQQIWHNGVSSHLFGTNDSFEAANNPVNLVTSPAIQQLVKDAGIPLMRIFMSKFQQPDTSPYTAMEAKIQACLNAGCTPLIVLDNYDTLSWAQRVVTQMGSRCNMYEFYNEPDLSGGLTYTQYLTYWNAAIPTLRAINPNALFFGPVLANMNVYPPAGNAFDWFDGFLQGVKTSGIWPNGITFHWYPGYALPFNRANTLALATHIGDLVNLMRQHTVTNLGIALPIGVTEWNISAIYPIDPAIHDPEFINQFMANAMTSMISSGLDFACQFDLSSAGTSALPLPVLDMVDNRDPANIRWHPQGLAFVNLLNQYRKP